MDIFTKAKRSEVMSRIRGRDTGPERTVRSLLHAMGYRFRVHVTGLPGTPDIVLPRYRTVVLVHGCFWHRHRGCRFAYSPKTHEAFWLAKFEATVRNDAEVEARLCAKGWRVLTIWECDLRNLDQLSLRLRATLTSAACEAGIGADGKPTPHA